MISSSALERLSASQPGLSLVAVGLSSAGIGSDIPIRSANSLPRGGIASSHSSAHGIPAISAIDPE